MANKSKEAEEIWLHSKRAKPLAFLGLAVTTFAALFLARDADTIVLFKISVSNSAFVAMIVALAKSKVKRRTKLGAGTIESGIPFRRRLLRSTELLAFFLPRKTRIEAFLPAYYEVQGDFVKGWRRHKSRGAQRLLTCLFVIHVAILFAQTVWAMCSDRVKRMILRLLPDMMRRVWGI